MNNLINKKTLLLLRKTIDKLDIQLWAAIEERLILWVNANKDTKTLYRKKFALFLKKKNLFKKLEQSFFLKFLTTIEIFCKKKTGSFQSVDAPSDIDCSLILSNDELLLQILEERFLVAYRIGLLKKKEKMAITDPVRYQQILEITQKKTEKLKVPKEMTVSLMELIHDYSVKIQEKI